MAGENDIEIKVTIDEAQARAILEQLDGSIKNISLSAEQGSKSFSLFDSATTAWNQGLELVQKTINGVSGTFNAFISAIEQGSAIDDVTSAFETLTQRAGGLSDVFLNDLKAATGETISSFELMQKANQALQAGIKPDQYVALTQAARALAEETGGNLTEELNKLERAFATGQDRLLKNRLGIIDLEKAQQSLAENLGTTIDKLTEEQKTFAARNAIVDAAKKKSEEFGKIQVDAGDAIAQVSAAISDQRDGIVKALGTNKLFTESMVALAKVIKDINFKPLIDGIAKFSNFLVSDLIPNVGRGIDVLKEFFGEQTEGQTFANEAVRQLSALTAAVNDTRTKAGLDDIAKRSQAIVDVLREMGTEVTPEVTKALDELTRETTQKLGQLEKELADVFGEGIKSGAEAIETVGTPAIVSAIKKVGSVASKAVNDKADPVFDFTAPISAALASGITSALNSSSLKDAFKGSAGVFGASIGGALGKVVGTDIVPALTSILGASFGGPAGAVGGQLFGGWVEKAINDFAAAVESGDFGGIAEGLVDSIFPGFGGFANDIVDSLFGGGDSAGTEARKSADKFFADIFDANRVAVVIDGKLTEISDLVFSGNQDGGLFSSLPAATQAAFSGIGAAFEGLLGIAGDLGVNIGNVFANNLGGSLNNLQILVQQTGISFDQLRDQVVKAFLDGKLSATQAAEALRGIEQISQKGIPDALGAVDQAFQNLIDSSTNGGAALVDALGDIAAEATELSITSLDKVREFLTQSGKFTEAQISQTFAALAANGINSIDQLQNVTAEQAIQIVAALEAAGFAFNETGSAVTNIAEELNNIPSEINTIVRVRYVAEGDSAAAEAVGQKIQDVTSTFTPSGEGISTTSSASSGSSSRRPVGGLA